MNAIFRGANNSQSKRGLVFGKLLCMIMSFMATESANASDINVLAVSNWASLDFTSSSAFDYVRADLLNSSLFGPSGTVTESVHFIKSVDSVTASRLVGANVVIYLASNQPNSSEISELRSFVESGGGVFIFGNNMNSFASLVGATSGSIIGGNQVNATITNPNSPLVNGPFGNLTIGSQFVLPHHSLFSSRAFFKLD